MNKKFSLSEIDDIAEEILQKTKSKILLFYGDLGSGKTTLIKALVKKLGCKQEVSSPTFSIVNEYVVDFGLVYHFDFYRLQDETEAFDIGFEEYLYSNNWCFIEWPEKVLNLLPEHAEKIILEGTDNSRKIEFNN